jgi:hypothetical protein
LIARSWSKFHMVDDNRRSFFKNLLKHITPCAEPLGESDAGRSEQSDFEKFFESYESSYALTLGYPDDILLETARMEGIECEGREKLDIVKELFLKKGGF